MQTLGFGVEEDVARLCAQEDVEALGGLEFHQPRLKQYTRTSKGMLSERRVPVTPGMAMIKFKYSREMMFIIGQSKLFAKFLSRKTTVRACVRARATCWRGRGRGRGRCALRPRPARLRGAPASLAGLGGATRRLLPRCPAGRPVGMLT